MDFCPPAGGEDLLDPVVLGLFIVLLLLLGDLLERLPGEDDDVDRELLPGLALPQQLRVVEIPDLELPDDRSDKQPPLGPVQRRAGVYNIGVLVLEFEFEFASGEVPDADLGFLVDGDRGLEAIVVEHPANRVVVGGFAALARSVELRG